MTEYLHKFVNGKSFVRFSPVLGILLLTAGCYTQLGVGYFEREPDYQEVTEYDTPYGDSVVVDNYYYDSHDGYYDHYYPRTFRYRRHFSTFYGHPYTVIDPYYDPFWYDPFYDDFWYGRSSLHLSFGWGRSFFGSPLGYGWHHPYRYDPYFYSGGYHGGWYGGGWYNTPGVYWSGRSGHYGPRGSRIGRGGVAAGGRYGIAEDDLRVGRRNAPNNQGKGTSALARSRTRSGVVAGGTTLRGVQRSGGSAEPSRTRGGVVRSTSGSGTTRSRPTTRSTTRTRGTVRSTPTTRSTTRTRGTVRSTPTTRSTTRTRGTV
ncbi:MAG: hypothetical protein OXD43_08315, partial [Bacteroidetes bacterium]|nr:hypothetical protein [Bacteroidota bacterium]